MQETIVVGAGCAGLSFSREWAAHSGETPLVLEKSRGVGGRCATRRVEGQPVDHGVCFLHGSDADFLEACTAAGEAMEGWPRVVAGEGRACQPRAFYGHERRFVFAEGLSAFPKSIALGLDVRLRTRAVGLAARADVVDILTEEGAKLTSRNLVLALPLEQTRALLDTLEAKSAELESVRGLLAMMSSEPCLTLIAGYALEGPKPDWDMLYPEETSIFALVSHDSSKRSSKRFHVLVYQATPGFSRRHLECEPSQWSERFLEEAFRRIGGWCRYPLWTQSHRWLHARVGAAASLSQPIQIVLPEGQRIGLVGEAFLPFGGVEAAFLSGRALARRWR
jgi:predicted NAD/FAD-dependent oxidoreductase